ncbi:MAG: hypothetical protein H7Y04_00670, partial [Verrucomicrobia bacterium]|nr:hypothetical protein [Cytophagales bacterium]
CGLRELGLPACPVGRSLVLRSFSFFTFILDKQKKSKKPELAQKLT